MKTLTENVGLKDARIFIAQKEWLQPELKKPTAFLFYAEKGFTREAKKLLHSAGIMTTTHALLTKQ